MNLLFMLICKHKYLKIETIQITYMNSPNGPYVLEIKTVQIAPFRTLMTALKDILSRNQHIFSTRWDSHRQYG